MKKLLIRSLLFFSLYAIGFVVGTELSNSSYENEIKRILEERYAIEKINIEVERMLTIKETNEEVLKTLWHVCSNNGGFIIQNVETNKTEIFKCSKEDESEYTMAWR